MQLKPWQHYAEHYEHEYEKVKLDVCIHNCETSHLTSWCLLFSNAFGKSTDGTEDTKGLATVKGPPFLRLHMQHSKMDWQFSHALKMASLFLSEATFNSAEAGISEVTAEISPAPIVTLVPTSALSVVLSSTMHSPGPVTRKLDPLHSPIF